MKKIFVLGLFLIVAVSSIGIIFAATEEIDGVYLTIPDGYKEVDTSTDYEAPFTIFTKYYENSKGDTLNITVETCDPGTVITRIDPGPHFDYKTLEGIDGIYTNKSPTTNSPVFKYVTEDNTKQVSIAASDASCIKKCLD